MLFPAEPSIFGGRFPRHVSRQVSGSPWSISLAWPETADNCGRAVLGRPSGGLETSEGQQFSVGDQFFGGFWDIFFGEVKSWDHDFGLFFWDLFFFGREEVTKCWDHLGNRLANIDHI